MGGMSRFHAGVVLLACLVLACGWPAHAAEPMLLTDAKPTVSLSPAMRYGVDAKLDLRAEDLFGKIDGDYFQDLPKGDPTFGFVDGAYWFHVRLGNGNPARRDYVLAVDYVLLDQIDLYLRRVDGSVAHEASGDHLRFQDRAYNYRAPNFLIRLEAGETVDVLLRVQSESSMQVPMTMYTEPAFLNQVRDAQFGIGIYYGMILALLLYNLILFASLRDANYLYYSTYVAGFGFVQYCLNGLAFEYLWPNSPRLANLAIPVSMAIGMLAMHQFVRVFLDLKQRLPIGNRILWGFIIFHALMLVVSFLAPYRVAVLPGTAAVFPGIAAIFGVSLVLALRGDRSARILLLAWGMLLLGTTVYAMVSFGVLPKMFLTEYGMQIGSALELILISFALAHRFASLRDENVRIVQASRDELEQRVEQRTRELSTTLNELAIANERLRESSLRDGLTGVFNRRYFDSTFEPLRDDCRAKGRDFSVLVADIDHFKQINDGAGHLIGDDCLHLAASVIERTVGDSGQVVRYGGEEFVVLMPDADETEMRSKANSIRAAIAASPLLTNGVPIPMTISVGGAHAAPGDSITAMDLLQQADEAMYKAKHQGRNRVVVH
ncbi:MAG: diguanylate cyclase [Gammaproteobacteria bacterium]|nr:MAG: diguanylate cyclase [Gammaproteobacteria bacterium]